MSARDLYLGIDVGTQGTKALLWDAEKDEVVARASRSYGLIQGLPPGHAEQDPRTWLDAATEAVRELGTSVDLPKEVQGLGVSGQQHGAVLLTANYDVARNAKLWCDTSTAEEAEELSRELGRKIPAGFTAPKLRWTATHEPGVWERTTHVILPHDFLNASLAHDLFTEAGDASGTGYFDPITGTYDQLALEIVAPGLGERVPRLVSCAEVAGEVQARPAERFGLRAGTPISAGGGDNMMSAIGSGTTKPGVVTCSLGTSATIFAFSDTPVMDPDGLIAPFRASSLAENGEPGHLPLLCTMNCTEPLEEICALTGKGHGELTALAEDVPAGCGGVEFVPFLVGERVPDLPNARGSISGLGLGSLRPGVLYRAALEGVSNNLAAGLDRMRAAGVVPEEIRLVGGAARNRLWQRILGEVFRVPIVRMDEPESAALGAAKQACTAVRG